MTNLYIDQEYNCPTNELISIALVGDDDREFYEVVEGAVVTDPWVEENVMPILNKDPIPLDEIQRKLVKFIKPYYGKDITIHADWPDDIAYFCRLLLVEPGVMINTKRHINFRLNRDLANGNSLIPHNALEDARAIALKAEELQNEST